MSTLVVAFDGLDKRFIDQLDLQNLQQEEYGTIDNTTDVYEIKTPELFASFITGENYELHGVKGMRHQPTSEKKPSREQMVVETLFDKIDKSESIEVPSWTTDPFWKTFGYMSLINDYSYEEVEEAYERTHLWRKVQLFRKMKEDLDFLMVHFHKPDIWQHLYYDTRKKEWSHDKILEIYNEMDEIAGEIKEEAEENGFDTVIFMSDHGFPTEEAHNEEAFYSSNKPLFDSEPKIFDFYDKILEQ